MDGALALAQVIRLANDMDLRIWRPRGWNCVPRRSCGNAPARFPIWTCWCWDGEPSPHQKWNWRTWQRRRDWCGRTRRCSRQGSSCYGGEAWISRGTGHVVTNVCAALELARQAHDEDLIRDIFAIVDEDSSARGVVWNTRHGQGVPDDLLPQVMEKERKAEAYPKNEADIHCFVVADTNAERQGWFEGDEEDWVTDEEEEEDEEEFDSDQPSLFDLGGPPDRMTPEMISQLARACEASGMASPEDLMRDPTVLVEAMGRMMGVTLSKAQVNALVEEMKGMVDGPEEPDGPGFFGRKSKKHNRRRR